LVEPGSTDAELVCGIGGAQQARVEVRKCPPDEIRRQAVDDLFLFKPGSSAKGAAPRRH
jgi:hypothetical protein